MKKITLILITNFILFLVPITANSMTIALHKTEVQSHQKKHKLRVKSDSNTGTFLMRFFLITGSVLAFIWWRVFYVILPNTLRWKQEFLLFFIGFGAGMLGIVFLLIGIILWFEKVTKEEKQKHKKAQ
jgi:cytochrome c biogenesis protein CcdA